MEVGKIIFLSFGDPNQNLHFHERINYIVMASQPRPHWRNLLVRPYDQGLWKSIAFP